MYLEKNQKVELPNDVLKCKVKSVIIYNSYEFEIYFVGINDTIKFGAYADCCDSNWFETWDDIHKLVGKYIDVIETVGGRETSSTKQECDVAIDIKITCTDKTEIYLVFKNSSNGYYGGCLKIDGYNGWGNEEFSNTEEVKTKKNDIRELYFMKPEDELQYLSKYVNIEYEMTQHPVRYCIAYVGGKSIEINFYNVQKSLFLHAMSDGDESTHFVLENFNNICDQYIESIMVESTENVGVKVVKIICDKVDYKFSLINPSGGKCFVRAQEGWYLWG